MDGVKKEMRRIKWEKRQSRENRHSSFDANTFRFCHVCRMLTRYKYNPAKEHSECSSCGSRRGGMKIG